MAGRPSPRPSPAAPVDAVIVLGAALVGPGVPGPALVRRLRHGVAVFRQLGARHLVLSGGVVQATPAEAVVMRTLALEQGVADTCIIVEDQSRNTFENGVYCGCLIRERRWQNVVVVTDGFHLPRALYVFRRLGLSIMGAGVPRPATMPVARWTRNYAVEMLRLARSAYLFSRGSHKPILKAVWRV